jgi:AAA-like domain
MDPAGPWHRLTLVLAYATEAALFITDQSQSPFNIGVQVTLTDFTWEQVVELNTRYGSPATTDAELDAIYQLVHGHPQLTQRALHAIASGAYTLDSLLEQAASETGPFGQDLRKLSALNLADEELAAYMKSVVTGQASGNRLAFYRLRSAGLLKGEWNVNEDIRCPLYRAYLKDVLS